MYHIKVSATLPRISSYYLHCDMGAFEKQPQLSYEFEFYKYFKEGIVRISKLN